MHTLVCKDFFMDKHRKGVYMKHFYTVDNMSKDQFMDHIKLAEACRTGDVHFERQIFIANLFFEPSTRTKMSFAVAEKKLGLEILDFHVEDSSVKKGESLYDTARTLQAIGAEALVIRHEADDWIGEVKDLNIPLINAGAGKFAHPSQSLLDAYTIYKEFGRFRGLKIVIAGDIKHSRVAHSSIGMFEKLGATVYLSGVEDFIDEDLKGYYIDFDEAIETCDVVMMLRIQHERHENTFDISTYHERFGLTIAREKKMKEGAIIMHPAPINRGVEIDSSLIECERSRIFEQMENGVYIRMAIIIKQLLKWGIIDDYQIN